MKPVSLFLTCAVALAISAVRAADAPPQQTILDSARGEFWSVENETFFVFDSSPAKRVTLTGTNLKIICDHLEITTVGLGKGDKTAAIPPLEKFKYLLATGNVNIQQTDREARAGRVEVFPRENKIVLTEKPVVVDHADDVTKDGVVDHANDKTFTGDTIEMFRGERRVHVINSHIEAPPIKDLGFDKNAKPAAPSPEPETKK